MAVRGLLFDKDGTLLDFERSWMPAYREALMLLGGGDEAWIERMLVAAGYDAETGRCLPGTPLTVGTTHDLLDLWRPETAAAERAPLIARLDEIFAESSVRNMQPVEGLAEVLAEFLEHGFVLGIATNDGTRSAELCVERLGLTQSFAFVTGYDGVEHAKPAPDMAHAFCGACGLVPSEIAVVGDNSHDLEMGRAAGVALCVGVLTGTGGHEDLAPHADLVLASIAELPSALQQTRK